MDTFGCGWKPRYGIRIAGTTKKRPLEETVTAPVPALVGRETWERAQTQRARNKELSPRNAQRQYLLRGMLRCGLCGMMYTGEFSRGRKHGHSDLGRRYYRDTRRVEYRFQLEGRCLNKPIRADAIEADIWDEIRELFQDPDKLLNELKAAQQSADEKLKPVRDKLQITEDLIKQAEEELDEIAMAMRAARGRMITKFEQQQDEINARLDALAKRRAKYIKEIGDGMVTDERIDTIMKAAHRVKRGIERANYQGKRRMLEALGTEVTVTPGKYHIKTLVGEKDGEISQMKRGGIRIVRNSY